MDSPAQGAARLGRAGALAVVVVGTSAAAHLAGGGSMPAPLLTVALTVVVAFGALVATGRKLSPVALVAILAMSQVGLHEAFMVLSSPSAAMPVAAPAGMSMAHHGGMPMALGASAQRVGMPAASSASVMTALHGVATVVLALLLARGEAALWALWAWLAPLVPLVVALFLPVPGRPSAPVEPRCLVPHLQVLLAGAPRRGPPGARGLRAP